MSQVDEVASFKSCFERSLSFDEAGQLLECNDDLSLAITEADMPFLITRVTPAWTKMCGYTQDQAVGRSFRLLQGAHTNSVRAEYLCKQAAEGLTAETYLSNYHQSGKVFCNHIRIVPLRSPDGNTVTHFLGYFEEVDNDFCCP